VPQPGLELWTHALRNRFRDAHCGTRNGRPHSPIGQKWPSTLFRIAERREALSFGQQDPLCPRVLCRQCDGDPRKIEARQATGRMPAGYETKPGRELPRISKAIVLPTEATAVDAVRRLFAI
jgi:hypothetical protein